MVLLDGAVARVVSAAPEGTDRDGSDMPGEFDVRFLTVAEVAAMMRVSKMTVYRLVHSGDLPAVRVGRSFRVPEQAVHDYLRDSFVDTA
jgi:excisionase family DNA binding protein